MKRAWKRNEEGVSPVIATILMVAITVVLAAVLYVMVMGMTPPEPGKTPLGLVQQGKTSASVSLLVANAPSTALVGGSRISVMRGGLPSQITNATVYDSAARLAAWYSPSDGWNFGEGYNQDSIKYDEGTMIVIVAPSIGSGDILTLTSPDGYFGTTSLKVS